MGYIILYALVFVIFLIFYIHKYKALDAGFVLLSLYTIIAVLGIFAYKLLQVDSFFSQYNFTNITLLPYLFLFLIIFMFLRPVLGLEKKIQKKQLLYNDSKLLIFSYVYILCALISSYLFYRLVSGYWMNDEWAKIRLDQYAGEAELAYNNTFERIFISFTMYFRIPATIAFFALLTKQNNIKYRFMFFSLFLISLVLPSIGDSMRTASRGMIVTLFIEFLLCFTFFKNNISRKMKKTLLFFSLFFVFFSYLYSSVVTESRFGEGNEAFISLICYWGQPPIVFNAGVASINSFYNGSYFFYPLLQSLGYDIFLSPTIIGGDWGPTFFTFVGALYADFTPLGVFVIALIIPYLMNNYIKKINYISINALYLILFYCTYLQDGALVTGRGFVYDVFIASIIYQLLRYFNPNFKKIQHI